MAVYVHGVDKARVRFSAPRLSGEKYGGSSILPGPINQKWKKIFPNLISAAMRTPVRRQSSSVMEKFFLVDNFPLSVKREFDAEYDRALFAGFEVKISLVCFSDEFGMIATKYLVQTQRRRLKPRIVSCVEVLQSHRNKIFSLTIFSIV